MTSLFSAIDAWITQQIGRRDGVSFLCVSGAQGIGKSTVLSEIEGTHDGDVLILGLDDFYLTKSERCALAKSVHPLLETRGPPGTHDIAILCDALDALINEQWQGSIFLPRFDKRADDRCLTANWRTISKRPRAVILEGWMVGALHQPLADDDAPLNPVEQLDQSGHWRAFQETALAQDYEPVWARAHAFCHIKAPSFDCVLGWRLQQERSNQGRPDAPLNTAQTAWVERFIQHYERLTRRMLAGHHVPGLDLHVDHQRRLVDVIQR